MHFLGPLGNIEPLLLILQEDRQTITVLCESPIEDSEACYEE